MKVDNAVIMAAGISSRFAPISYECHKALIEVKGEILIERQIEQLREAGIKEIIIVTGYMAEKFMYLKKKYNIEIVYNPEYLTRNNNGSIYAVKNYLKNTYICSADNYFSENPFEREVDESYYSVVFSRGYTKEWCVYEDKEGYINNVKIGGDNAWYMVGHTFWSQEFSKKFIEILEKIYNFEDTKSYLWEDIFVQHLEELKMKVRKYPPNTIFEFDSLDELRVFDDSYIEDSRSEILKDLSRKLMVKEGEINNIIPCKNKNTSAQGFQFEVNKNKYEYFYEEGRIREI